MSDSHLPCRSSQGHGRGMASVNQTRPHCVNQTGKTHSKPSAARHGRGTARAWHGHSMLCVSQPLEFKSLLGRGKKWRTALFWVILQPEGHISLAYFTTEAWNCTWINVYCFPIIENVSCNTYWVCCATKMCVCVFSNVGKHWSDVQLYHTMTCLWCEITS